VSRSLDPLMIQQFWVRVAASALFSLAALHVALCKRYSSHEKYWAYGIIGIILGYWLKM
jgi:hypothetical protein